MAAIASHELSYLNYRGEIPDATKATRTLTSRPFSYPNCWDMKNIVGRIMDVGGVAKREFAAPCQGPNTLSNPNPNPTGKKISFYVIATDLSNIITTAPRREMFFKLQV